MSGERFVVRARIHPMSEPGRVLDWMLVDDGRIEAAGPGEPPSDLPGDPPIRDLRPATIIPALHDCHVHFMQTGLMEVDVDLSRAERFSDVLALLDDGVSRCEGRILRGHSFDPDLLPDGRYPTLAEMDGISSTLPVFFKRRDGHSGVLNTAAWELLGVPEDTPGIERDASGRMTGTVREGAYKHSIRRVESFLTREERIDCYERAAALAAGRGIGIVHALAGSAQPGDVDVELLLEVKDSLPIDTVVYPQFEDVDRVVDLGLPRIGGCLLLDGSFSSGTAALEEPYTDREGSGVLYYEDEHLTDFFRRASERGLQISVHALGERAIDQAVRCYRSACGDDACARRHRIEHCELPSAEHIDAILELGVHPCVQPAFEFLWGGPGGMIEKRLGPYRALRTNPHRTMLEAGVPLAGGSDSYVTAMDSRFGIHSAVNRPNEAERLSVYDAVGLFTSGAARLSFDEDHRGTLEVGKDASFTALDEDPLEVPPDRLRDIGIAGLYLKGKEIRV